MCFHFNKKAWWQVKNEAGLGSFLRPVFEQGLFHDVYCKRCCQLVPKEQKNICGPMIIHRKIMQLRVHEIAVTRPVVSWLM